MAEGTAVLRRNRPGTKAQVRLAVAGWASGRRGHRGVGGGRGAERAGAAGGNGGAAAGGRGLLAYPHTPAAGPRGVGCCGTRSRGRARWWAALLWWESLAASGSLVSPPRPPRALWMEPAGGRGLSLLAATGRDTEAAPGQGPARGPAMQPLFCSQTGLLSGHCATGSLVSLSCVP